MNAAVSPTQRREWLLRYGGSIAASLLFLLFYYRGLACWFFQDDWGWLHIGLDTRENHILELLFAPKAHGNIRPWSENLYFFGLFKLFGVDAVPFRIVVFITAIGDLFLLGTLVRRLTSSRLAAFGAQIVWFFNAAVAPCFCWTCIYNETQYLFFLLAALLLFMEGKYWWQLAIFVIGLGSLETAVMYPCLASLFALLYDRRKLRSTFPLYLISAAYTAVHFLAAPAAKSGPYSMRVDWRIFRTLGAYINMALGPERFHHFKWDWPGWIFVVATAVVAAGVVAAIAANPRPGLFGAGWFLILLAPLLPLPDHVLDYLLTGPVMGLAIVLGAALASRWRNTAAALCGLYLLFSIPAAWFATTWNYERSQTARDLVDSVVEYSDSHPGKQLLLTGMSTDQFFAGFADLPFELYDMYNVHLAPGAEQAIDDQGRLAPLFLVPKDQVRELLDSGRGVVLNVAGGSLHDVTTAYKWRLKSELR